MKRLLALFISTTLLAATAVSAAEYDQIFNQRHISIYVRTSDAGHLSCVLLADAQSDGSWFGLEVDQTDHYFVTFGMGAAVPRGQRDDASLGFYMGDTPWTLHNGEEQPMDEGVSTRFDLGSHAENEVQLFLFDFATQAFIQVPAGRDGVLMELLLNGADRAALVLDGCRAGIVHRAGAH